MPHDGDALWEFLSGQGHLAERALSTPDAHVPLSDLAHGSSLGAPLEEFSDRSVLVATRGQLVAALALIELSGVARRVVLCPPDVSAEHVAIVIATAAVDTVVSDQRRDVAARPHVRTVLAGLPQRVSTGLSRRTRRRTEWILLTSGTTGAPKLVLHTLASLTGPIARDTAPVTTTVWSTFYDIRRYGGLQIFLRSVLGGGSLVLSDSGESADAFLGRVAALGVTHISGTPSHWRRALMSAAARKIAPRYVRLSGEIADQAILDRLRASYPDATIAHAFASTEAGVAFAVSDGRTGFPAGLIGDARGAVEKRIGDVEMKIEQGSLRIRSARTATRYLGDGAESLRDADGFVDTGDMVELVGDRYHFVGRRGGVINVGGLKVHPEEVEAVLNGHPEVRMSIVRPRKSPITGALVVAEVVATRDDLDDPARARLAEELLELCRRQLPRHKVPASLALVRSLAIAATGKIARSSRA